MGSLISNKASGSQLPQSLMKAENQFARLMEMDELDEWGVRNPFGLNEFENTLAFAIEAAYENSEDDVNHLFLQRILYRINRLKFFWYDDLSNYKNERSDYLRGIRNRIESIWARWETSQLSLERVEGIAVAEALRERAAADLAPVPST